MIAKLKQDLPASLVVFLIVLPLCLGIALASGAPILSGIFAGIIGGIVVGSLSQSHISVSGPAASLAALVLSSIARLGSFETFLLALVLAGAMQLLAGLLKSGFVANYIPSTVINGLLSAIGIILILKQIPHAVGFDRDAEGDFSFLQKDGKNTFSELLDIHNYFSWGAVIVSTISIAVLVYWDKTPLKKFKLFQAPLFVILFGVLANILYKNLVPGLTIAPEHLVNIPDFKGFNNLITLPNFSSIGNYEVWLVAISIAFIASIETLLNLEAIENIDPHKRIASPNKELVAQGIGNMFSGLIGGIPITSVIVRSSVNINAGAETKLSTILHGLLLLISFLLLAPVLNLIPLASLAAILIVTGYKLAKIAYIKKMYQKGLNQFIPFMATIIAIIFTDLLFGVLIGLVVSIFYILKSNFLNPFVLQVENSYNEKTIRLALPKQVSFLNKASIKDVLWGIPHQSRVIIDASSTKFIDNDVIEVILDFKNTVTKEKSIKLNTLGLEKFTKQADEIEFVNVLNRAAQQKISPNQILNILKEGNERFVAGNTTEKYFTHQVNATSAAQNPFAIILSCIDSRTTTEHVFDLGLGDIFSIRIAGNVLNKDILGSMEFGVHEAGVKLIVVLGHTKCGAIIGACNGLTLDNFTSLLHKVQPAIANETTITDNRTGGNTAFVNKVSLENVFYTIKKIKEESTMINELEETGKVKIVGAMYDIETGKVSFYE